MLESNDMSCFSRYSVLCVDDEEEFLHYLVSILKLYFANVYSAAGPKEAYNILESNSVDIIITDLYMPKTNGIDFIKHIRNERSDVSVIFLTACFERDFLHAAVPLCLDAYLVKPVSLESLFETLHKTIDHIEQRSKATYSLKGGTSFDLKDNVVYETATGKHIEVTQKELALLSLLVKNKNLILSKTLIEEELWDFKSVSDSSVKTLIKKLRNKIGCDAVLTHSNIGYSVAIERHI